MTRIASVLCPLACCVTSLAAAGDNQLNGYRFTLPDGFSIELAAGPPLVERPICIDYDEQGRLYVAESSGTNDPVKKQLEERPHRILRLEDTDDDGRYDKRTVFAEGMMFPEGAMWLAGSLYVAAPPVIWKLTDTDGDGIADRREEWFDGQTLTGCANDLHGPYRGPDGWIYWCKGAFAEQTHERPGRGPLVTRAAHIFRRRTEGGPVEAVMAGGMDNPVDVVFTPGGERIFTTTFLVHPGGGQRDGLIHAIYGGLYGKDHGVLDGHPRTGDLMPVLTHLGAAAPCGLACRQSDAWGEAYRGNLFATLFNMRKVTRHVLTTDGATFTARDEDFLVCDSLDFHPTDVIEDADGSLLVVDTGGWYKLCCPTSQLRKPDVLGGIYRVRRNGANTQDDPRGRRLDWSGPDAQTLVSRLRNDRHIVRRRATEMLATRGKTAVNAVSLLASEGKTARDRLAAVWALARMEGDEARAALRDALDDSDDVVRQAAIHAVGVWRDREAQSPLVGLLEHGTAQNRRAAAEALGRLGNADAVPALLAATARATDRAAEHSLIYALIEINDAAATRRGLEHDSADVQCAALLALDQMEAAAVPPEQVVQRLTAGDPRLRKTAAWIARQHPRWAPEMVSYFQTQLAAEQLTAPETDELEPLLTAFAGQSDIQRIMAAGLSDRSVSSQSQQVVLHALAASGLKEMPSACVSPVLSLLDDADPSTARAALTTTRTMTCPADAANRLTEVLMRLAADESRPATWRLEALSAVPDGLKTIDAATFALLGSHIAADIDVHDRSLAADVLAAARLSAEQLGQLAERIPDVGPLELERVLAAFGQFGEDRLALAALDSLRRNPAAASLPRDKLKGRFASFGGAVVARVDEFCAQLDAVSARQYERLDEVLGSLSTGDVRRGQLVFNSEKAACSACHAIGYLGGRIGPDLTRIGGIRSQRDLLESLLLPSASFVRSYESVIVVTSDGRSLNGLLHDSSASEVVITTSERKQIRIAREDIDEMQPGTVSIMPEGLEKQLTPQELADLLAFLMAAR